MRKTIAKNFGHEGSKQVRDSNHDCYPVIFLVSREQGKTKITCEVRGMTAF